ncbi:MAG: PD-(D/E)XK nuclease family protein [Candidatus Cloacimonetes bacterium]|nr:PD-(D/E)XK nuclease family protein [Candidatus Cloacimonadota bacterium]MDY0171618.1 PD-(D/E)XK nuclease family protein [Candidatus Cloacimonadaceae bacterium]
MQTTQQLFAEIAQRLTLLPKALPLSYSKAKALLGCGRRYCKTYLDKGTKGTPFDPSPAIVGKFVHGVLEACVKRTMIFGISEEAADFDKVWGDLYHGYSLTLEEKDLLEPLRGPTERTLKRVLAMASRYQLQLYPEQMFVLARNGKGMPACGWKDRLLYGYQDLKALNAPRTQAVIVDYKSHAPTEENQSAADVQTQIYALATFLQHPQVQKVQAGGAFIPAEEIILTTYTRDRLGELASSVLGFLEDFIEKHPKEGEVFEACPGKACEWCNFTEGCPEGQNYLSKKKKRSRTK